MLGFVYLTHHWSVFLNQKVTDRHHCHHKIQDYQACLQLVVHLQLA